MSTSSPRKIGLRLFFLSLTVTLAVLVLIGLKFKAANHDLENLVARTVKKQEILSRMRINLFKSVHIEKGAVMADTDEMSRALASESVQTADAVDGDLVELSKIIDEDNVDKEKMLLRDFNNCWDSLRKIDQVLLDFAVENTNIKASILSFSKGSKAIESFERDLESLMSSDSPSGQDSRVVRLASEALTAGCKVHYLQAPHIAAAFDAEMDKIEAQIAILNNQVRTSLEKLEPLVPDAQKPLLSRAISAYAEFEAVTAEVIRLSRQNTNIKSLELSLGRKRNVTSQCDEILADLQAVIGSRKFEATR
jgi:hypothetical protein